MSPTTRARLTALVVALGLQALAVVGVSRTSRNPDFGWFAYAPLTVADYRVDDPLLSQAYPGALAVALGVAFTVATVLTQKWTAIAVLAAAAGAAALAAGPGLSTPIGSAAIRLAVVLGPGLLVLALRRWTDGSWPWRAEGTTA